ncbi:hypothetical protein LSTR_LSTR001204 [Laodelphax striatellus]|uniref:Uncharacterized protein n=1 Tax=Laodelphax striatellus TaxID=195883 RepID=A0A482XB98_LAOST|nr:hypothetical protein LSTR_LSTR001204 [Laodelphax striatellus]
MSLNSRGPGPPLVLRPTLLIILIFFIGAVLSETNKKSSLHTLGGARAPLSWRHVNVSRARSILTLYSYYLYLASLVASWSSSVTHSQRNAHSKKPKQIIAALARPPSPSRLSNADRNCPTHCTGFYQRNQFMAYTYICCCAKLCAFQFQSLLSR